MIQNNENIQRVLSKILAFHLKGRQKRLKKHNGCLENWRKRLNSKKQVVYTHTNFNNLPSIMQLTS